jgi:hypothetical protein
MLFPRHSEAEWDLLLGEESEFASPVIVLLKVVPLVSVRARLPDPGAGVVRDIATMSNAE